jgi:hypothetical protein
VIIISKSDYHYRSKNQNIFHLNKKHNHHFFEGFVNEIKKFVERATRPTQNLSRFFEATIRFEFQTTTIKNITSPVRV